MVSIDRTRLAAVKFQDLLARAVITFGGITIIASVILIVALIVWVTIPLFLGASSTARIDIPMPRPGSDAEVLAVGVDLVVLGETRREDALSGYLVAEDGTFTFLEFADVASEEAGTSDGRMGTARTLGVETVVSPGGTPDARVAAVHAAGGSRYTLLWDDGAVSLVEAVLVGRFDEQGTRRVEHRLEVRAEAEPLAEGRVTMAQMRAGADGSFTCARVTADNRISVVRNVVVSQGLLGGSSTELKQLWIDEDIPGAVTALALNRAGDALYAGTENGRLLVVRMDDQGRIDSRETVSACDDPCKITGLAMVYGDVSLAVGTAEGRLSTWSEVRADGARRLTRIHELTGHRGPITAILPSQRDQTLMSLGENGEIHLDYVTSEKHLLQLGSDVPLQRAGYAERGNALAALDDEDRLHVWQIDPGHPEVSWRTLFGKVWYDNHEEPKYIWQSSGTDEPKFSLVPLVFGTMKATIYAMLFAVPLGLLGAMYVSHFTTPAFRRTIKPIVEVMAAVPSVVIGFLILLWLAPLLDNWLVAVFVSFVTLPLCFVVFMLAWQGLRSYDWAKRVENGYEFIVLVPVIIVGVLLAVWLEPFVTRTMFGGSFQQWLFDNTGNRYDPLNSLAVAFGLGFAVIPIIFSMSEDSLSAIPHELTAASLALGASRWQTVSRVTLPSASPGIFAAVMIGFGRAVGETMIVFMATGNTPVLDWSPFNGFRTLSANIAVEMPEAARGETLYRLLFLCAVILFGMTFLLNTVAEVVRQRLRKKFGRY